MNTSSLRTFLLRFEQQPLMINQDSGTGTGKLPKQIPVHTHSRAEHTNSLTDDVHCPVRALSSMSHHANTRQLLPRQGVGAQTAAKAVQSAAEETFQAVCPCQRLCWCPCSPLFRPSGLHQGTHKHGERSSPDCGSLVVPLHRSGMLLLSGTPFVCLRGMLAR